jgi:hypothetical protein
MGMSNKVYDQLKFVALILLPALATFYVTFAQIWGLPKGAEVSASIMAVDTLLGVLLGISTASYNRDVNVGTMHVTPDDGIQKHTLQLNDNVDPMQLQKKKEVRFQVSTNELPSPPRA